VEDEERKKGVKKREITGKQGNYFTEDMEKSFKSKCLTQT
jgi:hypothetical protein